MLTGNALAEAGVAGAGCGVRVDAAVGASVPGSDARHCGHSFRAAAGLQRHGLCMNVIG